MTKLSRIRLKNDCFISKRIEKEEFLLLNPEYDANKNFEDNLIIDYELNESKTNKKRFYFNHKNLNENLKTYIKSTRYLLKPVLIVSVIFIILYSLGIEGNLYVMIGTASIIWGLHKFYMFLNILWNIPKYLIIRNGYIYELNLLNFKINNFFFKKVMYDKGNDKFCYIYFKNKKWLIENSIIFFSNKDEFNMTFDFFENYVKISHDIDFFENPKE